MNTSKKIDFEELNNTRDLGGMVTSDGKKIREGVLYRSAALFTASEKDLEKLSGMNLCRIYDFRGEDDRSQHPDPEIPGCLNVWLQILPSTSPGVTHGKDSEAELVKAFQGLIEKPEKSCLMMADAYRKFVREEHCRKQYGSFLKDILEQAKETEEKGQQPAFLWHCAGGKDRAGFGAAILQEIFGVDRKDIFDDYMLTNTFMQGMAEAEAEKRRSQVTAIYGDRTEEIFSSFVKAITYLIEARIEYLETTYKCIEEDYGDFSHYLAEGLGFSENEQEEMRRLFLEHVL